MQSYTYYKVSEFLIDRHPYIPDPNPRPIIDPEQVAIAYNERAIPKLADLLIYKDLTSEKRRDALHTLNELVSNQECKVDMVNNNIVLYATNLMSDENYEVRYESAYLVGSLLFLDVGRNQFDSLDDNYKIMQSLIFDPKTQVRESVGWLLYRFSLHQDGTLMMNKSHTIYKMVDAFNYYSASTRISENCNYLLYILEALIILSRYDYGIFHMLNKGLLNSFNLILLNAGNSFSSELKVGLYEQMRELILCTMKNIVLIVEGKNEAFKENLILTVANYLSSDLENERLYSSSFFMSISNILDAKKQICTFVNNGKFEILNKICKLLEEKNLNIKNNSILCLRILSELPEGFLNIIDILYDKLLLMDEVFGVRSLKGLTELLPKLSKYKNPPHVEKESIPKCSKVIKGIIYFYKKYQDEALDILIHDTVNFAQKLGPFFILNDPTIHKWTKYLVDKICKKDLHNAQIIQKFIETYDGKDNKNISKDGSESLQLSEII